EIANENLLFLTRASCYSLRVFSAKQALLLLINSDRISHDFRQCELTRSFPLQIAIRKFVEFSPEFEFRGFVSRGTLTACTAYHQFLFIPMLVNKKTEYSDCIVKYWNSKIKPLVKCTDYTFDVVVSCDLTQVWLIEINYPPPIASTVLFDWTNSNDRKI